jgi:hypothetical protein
MRVIVTKNYHGVLSVREYQVKKAIESGEDLIIAHDGKEFVIPHDEIKERGKPSNVAPVSKFNGRSYRLIDFRLPRKKFLVSENQIPLIESK